MTAWTQWCKKNFGRLFQTRRVNHINQNCARS